MLSALTAAILSANGFVPTVTFDVRPTPTAAPTLQLGVLSEPLTGELSASAKAWALSRRNELGLHPQSTLVFETGFATRFGASLHYRQLIDGLELYQAKLVVTVDERMRVVQVSSSLIGARVVRSTPVISEAQAVVKATPLVAFPVMRADDTTRAAASAKTFLFDTGDALHVGYLMHLPTYDPTKNWYVAIDGVTGETLLSENRALKAEFDANVYPQSPGGLDAGVARVPPTVRPLVRADGGSYIASTCEVLLPDGGYVVAENADAGRLCSDQLTVLNCCTREGCAPDAGPHRIVGPSNFVVPGTNFSVNLNLDVTVCDRVNQATNQRPEGDFRYTPVDPPTNRAAVELDDPANSDTFAQVNAFYSVNQIYDWVRVLSSRAGSVYPTQQPAIVPFRMRDERKTPARRPAVLTNVLVPNFQAITGIPACLPPQFGGTGMGACVINGFTRFDNAQFLPAEDFAQLPIPGLSTGVDTLILYQGNGADPAYDATVVWHEFGHGVIHSTAGLSLSAIAFDARSANNEGGALHEGLADYLSAAFGRTPAMGPYFGPRAVAGSVMGIAQDGYLRSTANTFSCPDVLWGEVHQDSMHVSGALWAGRQANLGTDDGATYDAAFYAMLVSLAPNADFAQVAQVMAQRVSTAFTPAAGQALTQTFTQRGVIGCSKVLDVTDGAAARPAYIISGTMASTFPGPFQFKMRVPAGAQAIRVRAMSGGGGGGGGQQMLSVLTKSQQAITFTRSGANAVTHDAEFTGSIALSNNIDARVPVAVPCGQEKEVYVAFVGRPTTLQNLQVSAEALVNCMLPTDGGMPVDAGMEPDAGQAGSETKRLPAVSLVSQPTAQSCGCSTDGAMAGLFGLALLLARRVRR